MRSAAAVALGSVSILLGAVGMLFAWVPLVGFLAIPLGVVGGLLAVMGVCAALMKGGGMGTPVAGGILSLMTVLTPIFITGALFAAADSAVESEPKTSRPSGEISDANGWTMEPVREPKPEPDPEPAPTPEPEPELQPEETLTPVRTWTNKEGKEMKASLVRLYKLEVYHGVFRKEDGETFDYKIGNLSEEDIELVKELVKSE